MSKKVQLGKSDLYINPIGFGANSVGGQNFYPNLTDEEAGKKLVHAAVDAGINFIDTAYLYGPGTSEELIGQALKESGKRSEVIIGTKGGYRPVGNEMVVDNSPEFLRQTFEESLKRLQTDYIDLYYIHFPDENTPKDEAIGVLKQLKDEGKIRAIGVSNFSIDQLKEGNKDGYIEVFQGAYNLVNRSAEEDLLPYCAQNNISFIPFFPLAQGLLAGKYTKDTKFDDFRKGRSFLEGEGLVRNLEKVEQVRKIANAKEVEVAQVVLAWYLTHDAIDSIIPGAKRPDQILNNLKTLEVVLTPGEIQEIDRIFS
ncbi:aldo/keto reductase [Bacillus sp. B15-48]|uniref:aldo/keto reductase n=1 Tax=Bacillus sp. B15-48 TaxID=1548601 RepID=UPI00193F4FCA|nr:aldo/keto reductase [Bacillus sp. B15-48]MBM4761342.1 oxidoreductase [Bacillus sp. B15-48]